MTRRLNISQARKELFELFESVTSRDGEKVVIRRRDSRTEAVLVSRDYVDRIESTNRRLVPRTTFRLKGSLSIAGRPDEVLREVREEQARLADEKLDSIFRLPKRR